MLKRVLRKYHLELKDIKGVVDNDYFPLLDQVVILKKGKSDIRKIIEKIISKNPLLIITNANYKHPKVFTTPFLNYYKNKLIKHIYDLKKDYELIGVIGTSGKTSTCNIISKLETREHILITTGHIKYAGKEIKINNTTPSYLTYLYLINNFPKPLIISEVSSQGYKRIKKLKFTKTIFLNIAREHLDYHKFFIFYLLTKFKLLVKGQQRFVNVDSKVGKLFKLLLKRVSSFSLKEVEIVNLLPIKFKYQSHLIQTSLKGKYNIYNILAALKVLNISKDINLNIKIKGRDNYYLINNQKIIIDYAHNLLSVRSFLDCYKEKYPCFTILIGFGGNRYKAKRVAILNELNKYNCKIIISEDNSRFESFNSIIKSLLKAKLKEINIIENRLEALKYALKVSSDNVLIILGKGEEEYLLKNGDKMPFNDLKEIIKILKCSN